MPKRDRAAYMREYRAKRSPKRAKLIAAVPELMAMQSAATESAVEIIHRSMGIKPIIGFDPLTGAPIYREGK